MTKLYHTLFILTFSLLITVTSNAQMFVNVNAGLTGLSNGSAMWGDYDNDHDLDILVTGIAAGGARMTKIYNNDNGSFSDINAGLPGLENGTVKWGDYDNDGDLDILMTGINNEERTFLYKNTDGSFEMVSVELGYFDAYSYCCWGDYDNDGDLDAFITGNWNSTLYRNDGNDVFTATDQEFIMMNSGRAVFGDLDKDGDADLLFTGDTGGGMKIFYYENNNGSFTEQQLSIQGYSAGSIELGDYDDDGDPDILMMGYNDYLEPQAEIFRNDGDMNFAPIYAGLAPVALGKATWGDIDNDGDLDCAVTGKLSGCGVFATEVYENIGNDWFNSLNAGITAAEYSYLAWGDYDNDSDLDLLLAGADYNGNHFTKLYRNDMSLPNFLPEAPQNLSVDFTGDEVVFSWEPGSDQQTPAQGLTYNIRIGTDPAGCNNLSPMAHLNDGYRKLAIPGNTTQTTSWKIRGLEEGATYYWSVQTIDHTYGASSFSEEMAFTVLYTDINGNQNPHNDLLFYPNPAQDYIQLSTAVKNLQYFSIYQVGGENILLIESPTPRQRVDLSDLKPGVYIVQYTDPDGVHTEKLVVR